MIFRSRILSRIKVSHFPESKTTYFLEVEDYEELRGQSFSIVGHKHGTPQNITTVYSEFWSDFLSLTRTQILQKERTPCSCKPKKKITWSSGVDTRDGSADKSEHFLTFPGWKWMAFCFSIKIRLFLLLLWLKE